MNLRDFIAGCGAGMCGLLVGHPADTIKVKQQVAIQSNVITVFVSTVKHEGLLGLYKGLFFPLMWAGIQKSIFFGVYGNTLRYLQRNQGADSSRRTCGEGSRANRYWHMNVYVSGFTAGIFHTFIACPVELVKTKIQIKKADVPKGEIKMVQEKLSKINYVTGIKGYYRGFAAMLLRDVPTFGLFVLVYEHLLSFRRYDDRRSEYTVTRQLIAGGIAGTVTWVARVPMDVVKSRIQADDIANPRYRGVIDCFITSYKEGGFKVFTRGLTIHVLRSFPVSAAIFTGYEFFYRLFKFLD